MDSMEDRLRKEHSNLTYDEIMELLEEEQFKYEDEDYKPLNFHEDCEEDEDF